MRSILTVCCFALILGMSVLSGIDARAAVMDWNGGTGDWYASGNWTPNGAPGAADTRNIASGTANLTTTPDLWINGGGSINLSGTGTINRSTTHWTRFGNGTAGTYTQTGGTFISGSNRFYIGVSAGYGTADITGGKFSYTNGGDFIVGNDTAIGTLNLGGDSTFNSTNANFRLGVDNLGLGQGILNISDTADVNLKWLSLGQGAVGSQGHVNMSGGTLDLTQDLRVGMKSGATSTFTQSGGIVTLPRYLYVGRDGGTGVYYLDGGTLNANGDDTYIARGGTASDGSVVQTGGTFNNNGWLNIGALDGGTGNYDISGGTLATGTLAVGREGYGTMDISQAPGETTTVTTNGFNLGYYATAAGSSLTMSGGTLSMNAASYIGRAAADVTFTQTGGTVNGPNADLIVGYGASSATLTVDGGTFSQTGGNFRVGVDNTGTGQGTFNLVSGDVDLRYLSVAQGNPSSKGDVTVSGGTLDISSTFRVGLNGPGTYTQDGGTVTAIGGGDHFLGLGTGSAVVTINDGTLTHTGGNTRLGVDTSGSLIINGGDVDLNWLSMAQGNSDSDASVVMTGGTLDVNQQIRVGTSNGEATFLQTGGIVGGNKVRTLLIGGGSSDGTYTLHDGLLFASTLTDGDSGTTTLEIEGGLASFTVSNNTTGAMNFDHANTLLNPQVGSTGLTTVNLSGPAATAALGGSLDADVFGGAMFNPSDTFDVVTASSITGASGITVVDDEGLWLTNKDSATTALTLSLAPAVEQEQVTIFEDPIAIADLDAGWFDLVKGVNRFDDFSIELTLSGTGDISDLADWMTDSGLNVTADDTASTLTFNDLANPTGLQSYFAWDFTDYNALYGTSFAVSAAYANAVPEPSTWALLVIGLAGLGLVRRRRR